jgi:hypothetical protein
MTRLWFTILSNWNKHKLPAYVRLPRVMEAHNKPNQTTAPKV